MDEILKHIQENANFVAEKFELGFNEETIKFLEGFIERQRARTPGERFEGLINTLGSFLGECIIRNFGGTWVQEEDGTIGLKFTGNERAFPFTKVEKQFQNGLEDSIYSFYTVIPKFFKLEK